MSSHIPSNTLAVEQALSELIGIFGRVTYERSKRLLGEELSDRFKKGWEETAPLIPFCKPVS